MAFTVVAIFTIFFSSCKKSDPVVPVIETTIPVINTVSITKLTPASAEVNAEIISDGGEAITSAGICWVVGVEPNIYSNLVPATVKSGAYSATVNNLQQKTAYYFRAYATNKNGTAYGESVYFYDESVITPVKAFVAARLATKVTMTTATITAVLVPMQADTKASFEYQKNSESTWKKFDLSLALEGKNLKDSIKLSLDLSDLTSNTGYSFRIKASNSAGEVTSESSFTTYAVADLDGNLYHGVQIGDQIWLQENLRTTKYANGDPIANVTDPVAWGKLTTAAYCWYNNDPEIGKVYGGLYNFYVGADNRKLIKGWHVPTDEEWNTLNVYLGGSTNANGWQMKEVGTTHWLETNMEVTNSSGFTALPNGYFRRYTTNDWTFTGLRELASFWSSSIFGPGAMFAYIDKNALSVGGSIDLTKGIGIRLVKDK